MTTNTGLPNVADEDEETDTGWGHFGHCPLADTRGETSEECVCDQLEAEIVSGRDDAA